MILMKYWLKRFAQLLVISLAVLSVAELGNDDGYSVLFVVLWAVLAAAVGATVVVFWVYRKHYKMVYRD